MAGLSQARLMPGSAHFDHVRASALGRRGHLETQTSVPLTTTLTNVPTTTSTSTSGTTAASTSTSATPATTSTSLAVPAVPMTPMTPAGVTTMPGTWVGAAGSGDQSFMQVGGMVGGGIGGIGSLGGLLGPALSGPAPKAPTQGTSGTTTPPTQLQTDLKKLQTDLQAINDKSQVTPALLAAVRNDAQKIQSEATTAPSQTTLSTLESDVKALNGQLPTSAQTTQLDSDFTAVVQSEGVTDSSLISQTISDIAAVVAATNITSSDLSTIAADQKAIQTDIGTATGATAATGQNAGAELVSGLTGGSLATPMLQTQSGSVSTGTAQGYFLGGPMLSGGSTGSGPVLIRSSGVANATGFGGPMLSGGSTGSGPVLIRSSGVADATGFGIPYGGGFGI
jgi:hypothetical protein